MLEDENMAMKELVCVGYESKGGSVRYGLGSGCEPRVRIDGPGLRFVHSRGTRQRREA